MRLGLTEPPGSGECSEAVSSPQFLESDRAEASFVLWKEAIAKYPLALDLPMDRVRPTQLSGESVRATGLIESGLMNELVDVADEESATLADVVLAGFFLLLNRLTGEPGIVVGVTGVPGVTPCGQESPDGPPIPVFVRSEEPFPCLLGAVRSSWGEAQRFLTKHRTQEPNGFDQAGGKCQVGFASIEFEHRPALADCRAPSSLPSLIAIASEEKLAHVPDLRLIATDSPDGMQLELEGSADLFEASTLDRWLGHLRTLLVSATEQPDAPVQTLAILTESERQVLVHEWNSTAVDFPEIRSGQATVHGLFEAQVERTPHAVAVEFEGQTLTYGCLNARANQLARYLVECGVAPDVPVGLCVERSLELVVGLLGILKAGGAYVPLDPDYPADRLGMMLASASPPVVLTQSHLASRLAGCTARVFRLDADWDQMASLPESNLGSTSGPSDLAYIIYTSGSTGVPKGVMNEHRGVCNRLVWMQAAYELGPADRVLQKTPFSFDVSVWEFFWTLLTGAQMVLARPGGHREPGYLADLICSSGVTVAHFVPSMLQVVLDEPGLKPRCHSLRHLFASGEALPEDLARRCLSIIPSRLHNLYGPTEAAVDVTFHECLADNPAGAIPIGRPIANIQTYVLDSHMQPQPIGIPGELYLGGVGVARGYLGQPELTGERFVADPFSSEPGARLYRTGDLARWRSDGEIEYLGRLDFQIKIRGFRIELGEVESALVGLAGIRQAVAVAQEHASGEKRLVAYLVGSRELSEEKIRQELGRTLPEYMVPPVFVWLDELPLTTSGKVDRKALPVPAFVSGILQAFEPPQTPLEVTLAGIWQALLGVERVGRHDHFLRLGGHSLLAARFVNRARASGMELKVRDVFERPTVAELAAYLQSAHVEHAPQPSSASLKIGAGALASYAQQRLWFIDQLEGPGLSAYNITLATRMEGKLSPGALQQALNDVVARHEPLRTRFAVCDGQPVPIVQPGVSMTLAVEDLQAIPEPERCKRVEHQARQEADHPFDLSQAPLIRSRLLQIAENEHVLLVTVHHIAFDGWSSHVFWQELAEAYHARTQGQVHAFSALPISYSDYSAWQREQLGTDGFEESLGYWKEQLAGLEDLELPGDRPRPARLSYQGERVTFVMPADLSARLKALCDASNTTLHMIFLAGFQALLGRLTGQDDFAVAVPAAGRPRPELEGLIGFFVNTLVLRADLSGNPSFREFLARTRATSLDAQTHEEVPFERVVEELRLDRQRNRNPLAQVIFQYLDAATIDFQASELKATPLADPGLHTRFDLELLIQPVGAELRGSFCFSNDLFDRVTIERLSVHYQTLLRAAVEQPETSVGQLPLLTASERNQLLEEWNETEASHSVPACLHTLFEAQVERTPHAVAVEFEGQTLTYAELNTHADLLKPHLLKFGVAPGVLVGLCLDRSIEMIIGILGILKAGGAYVPLDPKTSAERLRMMVVDSNPAVVLTTRSSRELVPTLAPLLVLDEFNWTREADGANSLTEAVRPLSVTDDPAYVIYTSGSTGVPKGVVVTHANVSRLFKATEPWFHFGPTDVWTMFHSYAFDFSVWELWGALLYGGRLVVVPWEVSRSPGDFLDLLVRSRVTVLNQTPSAFYQLIQAEREAPQTGKALCLRLVIFGGEALDFSRLEDWYSRHSDDSPVLVNMYGITETTVHVTYQPLTRELARSERSSLIGKPIPDLRLYVLDDFREPVPVGVVGELYVSGAGVASGYLNRPELTAERFVADSFVSNRAIRMYKTGDLVRRRADGGLEYLGRSDFQVKLRGFRIELGEIETVLRRHPDIREAVVLLREDRPGDQRLVAYVVSAVSDSRVDAHELRTFLLQVMPDYMVPATYVCLEGIPLNSNGKVDRKALPVPAFVSGILQAFEPPQTPLEVTLAGIWQSLLGMERVGRHDHFFRLGGHSLLAARVVSRAAARGIMLRVRDLFEHPTLAGLAAAVAIYAETDTTQEPIRRLTAGEELPVSFAQQRLWFIDQLEGPGLSAYNSGMAFRLTGPVSQDSLRQALADVAMRHAPLRTTFRSHQGRVIPIIDACSDIEMIFNDLRELTQRDLEAELERLSRLEVDRPFDLLHGPLVRGRLIQTEASEYHLLIVAHHVAFDGWSGGVFWQDLSVAYQAREAGLLPDFSPLPIQYTDYAAWQREQLQGGHVRASLAYWKARLAGLEDLELPADHVRPPLLKYEGDRLDFTLPASLSTSIQNLCAESGVTLHMALLAGFQLLLGRLTGRENLAVAVPTAGRTRPELEGLVGFFVNTLVMRADFAGNPSFREILSKTRTLALDAHEHQDVPFEWLVEELQPPRHRNRNPLVQVLFQYQDADEPIPLCKAVLATAAALPTTRVRFDVELHMEPSGDQLAGGLFYSTELFDRATMAQLVVRFEQVLATVLASPDAPAFDIPVTTQDEKALFSAWNSTEEEYPKNQTLHQLFEEQVQKNPGRTALEFGSEQWSYAELNRHADKLASRLILLGVGPGASVGLFVERGPWMVASVLGILKAGAAYVPLDAGFPEERLTFMIHDAGLKLVVTSGELSDRIRLAGVQRIEPGGETGQLMPVASGKPLTNATAESYAYFIYTSGSTGRPKGVPVTHRAVVNLLHSMGKHLEFQEQETVLALASLSFDISVLEVLLPLTNGGRVVIVSSECARDAVLLAETIKRSNITTMQATPSSWRLLREVGWTGVPGLKILCGGEPLSPDLAAYLLNCGEAVWNVYGPTETTIWSTAHRVTSPEQSSIVGRPIANTQAYVLDAHGQLAPIGVAGELYLGGHGVARGYWNRPELTAERFLADPFSTDPDARMYRTGDLARWLRGGELEFLGRVDFQVKLRGFRIELGEIESALVRCGEIRQAVVVAIEVRPGHMVLVAYLVGAENISDSEIRESLGTVLPEYMIPTSFVRLESFPLTTSGKVNREALPAPALSVGAGVGESGLVGASTPLEAALVEIWQELLGVSPVGVRDNFFELGGHSLLAIRLLAAIEQKLEYRFSLATLFDHPTIAQLAREMAAREHRQARAQVVMLKEGAGDGPTLLVLPSVFGEIGQMNLLAQELPSTYRVYGFAVEGDEPYWPGCVSIADMAAGYCSALQAAGVSGPLVVVGYSFGGYVGYELARVLVDAGREVVQVVLVDTSVEVGQRRWQDRLLRDVPSMVRNVPLKVWDEVLPDIGEFASGVGRLLQYRVIRPVGRALKRLRGQVVHSRRYEQRFGDEAIDGLELPHIYERRLDASMRALRSYVPGKYSGDVTILACRTREVLHRREPGLGWSSWTTGQVFVRQISGHHHNLFKAPHLEGLCQELTKLLCSLYEETNEPEQKSNTTIFDVVVRDREALRSKSSLQR